MSRGTCQICDRSFSLKKDGTLRAHGYHPSPYYASGGCDGSGKLPAEHIKTELRKLIKPQNTGPVSGGFISKENL